MGMSPYFRGLREKVGPALLQMPSVTIINLDQSGRALLIKHRDTRLWVAPGGAIEPGETPADAAVRVLMDTKTASYSPASWNPATASPNEHE